MQNDNTGNTKIRFQQLPLLIIALFLVQAFFSCSKHPIGGKEDPQPDPDSRPLQLPHGSPTGTATRVVIGPEGGTLTSGDGNIKIDIPAGAVDAATTFSIQEVENVLKNRAHSYRLLPEGLPFKKPVQLTYSYSTMVMDGSNPDFFFLAYQDKDGYFYAANKTRGDRQKQTLTVSTTHFSDWTFYMQYDLYFPNRRLVNGDLRLMEGEEAVIELHADYGNRHEGEYSRMQLPDPKVHIPLKNAAWDYAPKKGVISMNPQPASVVYKAPAKVNSDERIYINVTINGDLGTDNLGNKVQQMQIRQPVVISPEGYFRIYENGVELMADSFGGAFIQLIGSQLNARFPNGYNLNCYAYGTTGSFSYNQHYLPGGAVLELSQQDKHGMGVMRAKICDKDPTPVFSPGEFTLKSIALKEGEYFEGAFSATLYGYDFCENGRTKSLFGEFRFKKTTEQ